MDPLTIGLLIGGGYLLLKGSTPAAPVATAPAVMAPIPMTSAPSSIIQYTSSAPPARGVEDTGASPIEVTGYIPPYVDPASLPPGASAVALGGMSACACANCSGLGDVRSDRTQTRNQLATLRAMYAPMIAAAIQAHDGGAITDLSNRLNNQMRQILETYHAKNPNDRREVMRVAPSVAPVFLGRKTSRLISTNV